ncbi:MAG: ABC transporter permease, partial [Nocardioides sp.]
FLGRDVLSRVLAGGRTVVLIGVAATALSYVLGLGIGIYTGLRGGATDFLLMRGVDLLTVIPAILYLLLLASGLGRHIWVLVLGMVIVLFPPVSRVIRTATLAVARSGYVEAAQVRGDPTLTICLRDILPNILPNVLADFGIRFASSILLVAAMNFLGLGLTPPVADWGLMTSENQPIIGLNVLAVLAPASMLAVLTVSINLIADAYLTTLGRSSAAGPRRWFARRAAAPAVVPVSAGMPLGTSLREVGPA